jgi:hypothetical protein
VHKEAKQRTFMVTVIEDVSKKKRKTAGGSRAGTDARSMNLYSSVSSTWPIRAWREPGEQRQG